MKIQTLSCLGAALLLALGTGCSSLNWHPFGAKNETEAEAHAEAQEEAKARAEAKAKEEAKAREEARIRKEVDSRVKAEMEARAMAEAEAKDKVPRAGEDLLKAFLAADAEKFLSMLPEVVRDEFGTKGFERTMESMQEQLGTPVGYEFVFNLEHPKFTVSIWKVRFERDNADKTKKIHQEALFRAISGEIDGQEKLLGFNFF